MPAIQPARLKKQVSDLVGRYDQPSTFVRDLHALLDWYTDHTHRSGQAGEPFLLAQAYNTPPPVMRLVWHELERKANSRPDGILPLCDALWAEPNYDMQILSARLLGLVAVNSPGQVIERLHSWVRSGLEKQLLDGVLDGSLVLLFSETPDQLIELISSWLDSSDLPSEQAGLRALKAVIKQSGKENYPIIIRLLTPYLRKAPTRLRPDILAVLSALVHQSPAETAYALRQNLAAPENPDTAWLIRQVVNEFPDEIRIGLRQAMKTAG